MLSDFLDKKRVFLNFPADSLQEAIELMLERSGYTDRTAIMDRISQREALMATTIGKGVALPRVIIPDKQRSEIIVAITKKGISSHGFDMIPTMIIVLYLFSPEDDHATLLAESLRLLNDDTLRDELLKVHNGSDFIETIRRWEQE